MGGDCHGEIETIIENLQITDTLPLATYEAVCSIDSMEFADDSSTYYVVGTAVAVPEQPEPTKVSAFCLCHHRFLLCHHRFLLCQRAL